MAPRAGSARSPKPGEGQAELAGRSAFRNGSPWQTQRRSRATMTTSSSAPARPVACWRTVSPPIRRHEDHFLGESEAHAVGGELRIEAPRVRWDILDAFCAAAEEAGIKRIADFNTGDNEGSCVFHVNQKRGRRWSAARAFLKPVLK